MSEDEYIGITSAGVEHVEVNMPEKSEWSFFQELVYERPDLDQRLVFLHFYINKQRREKGWQDKTIRETTYDLLEHVVNQWTVADDDEVRSLSGKAKTEVET